MIATEKQEKSKLRFFKNLEDFRIKNEKAEAEAKEKYIQLVQSIKEEMAYNKANGIKMKIEDEEENLSTQQRKFKMLLVLDALTVDDIAEQIDRYMDEYVICKMSLINQMLYKDFCTKNNSKTFLYPDFKKHIKKLLDDSDFGMELYNQIEENKVTYGTLMSLTKRSLIEEKEAQRMANGKIYLERMRNKLNMN